MQRTLMYDGRPESSGVNVPGGTKSKEAMVCSLAYVKEKLTGPQANSLRPPEMAPAEWEAHRKALLPSHCLKPLCRFCCNVTVSHTHFRSVSNCLPIHAAGCPSRVLTRSLGSPPYPLPAQQSEDTPAGYYWLLGLLPDFPTPMCSLSRLVKCLLLEGTGWFSEVLTASECHSLCVCSL